MLTRIHIDARWAADLLRALEETACTVFRRDDDTLDVLVPSGNDGEQAGEELNFFLRAWALDHPHAGLRVGR